MGSCPDTDDVLKLTRVDWRSMIESYLLSIEVEAQC